MSSLMLSLLTRGLTAAFIVWAAALCVQSGWNVFVGVALFVFLLPLSVLVHEFGHVLAAIAVRWKVVVISVGWMGFHLHNRQLLFSKRMKLGDAGGWVFAGPTEPQQNTFQRHAVFILGGPLASLLLALLCFGLVAELTPKSVGISFRYDLVVAALGAIALAHFVSTLIPAVSLKFNRKNDGAQVLALWRSPDHEVALFPVQVRHMLLQCNVRLRDLPVWLFENLRENSERLPDLARVNASLNIGRMLDSLRVDSASVRREIDKFWLDYEPSNWLKACDAYLAAVYEKDVGRARTMVSQFEEPETDPRMEYAAKAALSMLAGNQIAAAEFLISMDRAVAKASPYCSPTFRDIRSQVLALNI